MYFFFFLYIFSSILIKRERILVKHLATNIIQRKVRHRAFTWHGISQHTCLRIPVANDIISRNRRWIGRKAQRGRLIMRLVNTEKLYVINVYCIISGYDMACVFNTWSDYFSIMWYGTYRQLSGLLLLLSLVFQLLINSLCTLYARVIYCIFYLTSIFQFFISISSAWTFFY